MRITLIDDSEGVGDKIHRALRGKNYLLQAITNEPFFNDQIEKEIGDFGPNLIILDLLLVEDISSGFRVLRQIRESHILQKIPVMVCSKYINAETGKGKELRQMAINLGAKMAIDKSDLATQLSDWCKKHHAI